MSGLNLSKKVFRRHDDEIENANASSDEDYSQTDSIMDSEEDTDFHPKEQQLNRLRTSNQNNGSSIQRKPTRVPNNKIQNRNALLARENRKRKKEMMETMEKSLSDLQQQNKKLHKMLKVKDIRIKKMEKESSYLKSVIFNHKEIVSVLKSLPKFNNCSSEQQKIKTEIKQSPKSTGSYTSSCETFDDNGSVNLWEEDPMLSTYIDSFLSTDFEISSPLAVNDWDDILKNPYSSASFQNIPQLEDSSILSPSASPTSEHNYFDKNSNILNANSTNTPGVCVHINSGRVSLEFCSSCHYNAHNNWSEDN